MDAEARAQRGYLAQEPALLKPYIVEARAEESSSLTAYAYGANNPVSRADADGLLDYRIDCPSRGRPNYWIHPPGNTPCEDCKHLDDAAAVWCASHPVGDCSCAALQKLADKACKGCQSRNPPPAPPPRPPIFPKPASNLRACR